MVDHLGEQFGDYRLTRKLGGGNFGDVYLGENVKNKTPSAVKVLQARLTNRDCHATFTGATAIFM